jgi:hypothetical protein
MKKKISHTKLLSQSIVVIIYLSQVLEIRT